MKAEILVRTGTLSLSQKPVSETSPHRNRGLSVRQIDLWPGETLNDGSLAQKAKVDM